jgi:hypothetical protein
VTAKKKKNDASAKLDADLLRQAKVICAYRGLEMYDYLNGILAGPIGADFRKIVKAEAHDGRAEKGGKS